MFAHVKPYFYGICAQAIEVIVGPYEVVVMSYEVIVN